ncbi:hypothetical protein NC652_020275 [Populus alba x Populus x berolinensis]|nr:hypothetical protein NC652_020275 [Populus alba x Populus x berolinensis]
MYEGCLMGKANKRRKSVFMKVADPSI